ncbi:MAG: hypothetical protein HY744_11725 [Deltaproteobacteria bacterium]|nr:hypothetical protein [Deltaproteobacteria bacterium]
MLGSCSGTVSVDWWPSESTGGGTSSAAGVGGAAGAASSSSVGGGGGASTTGGAAGGCSTGLELCGSECVDTDSDVENCGACMKACTNPNGSTACVGGVCSPTCDEGFGNCDGNSANGCETDTLTSMNCGGCDKPCTNPNGSTACVGGVCSPTCDEGFGNCDGNNANGCEANTLTSAKNCGGCGTSCAAKELCALGVCEPCFVDLGAGDHTCATKGNGALWCWGSNFYGELGDGTTIDRLVPIHVAALADSAMRVAVGYSHTCARKGDGTLWCWGWNEYGQVGNGTKINTKSPVQVKALGTTVIDVAAGYRHTCGRKADGSLWCWGQNGHGQVGDGSQGIDKLLPVKALLACP